MVVVGVVQWWSSVVVVVGVFRWWSRVVVRVGLVPFRLLLCLPDSLCSTARKNDVAVWLGAV